MQLSERIYQVLLLAYPRRFRRQYGEGMVSLFRARRARARREGGLSPWSHFWIEILKDLFTTAPPERLESWELQGPRVRRAQSSRSHRREELSDRPSRIVMWRRESLVDAFLQDFKQSLRRLSSSPGFTLMALLIPGRTDEGLALRVGRAVSG